MGTSVYHFVRRPGTLDWDMSLGGCRYVIDAHLQKPEVHLRDRTGSKRCGPCTKRRDLMWYRSLCSCDRSESHICNIIFQFHVTETCRPYCRLVFVQNWYPNGTRKMVLSDSRNSRRPVLTNPLHCLYKHWTCDLQRASTSRSPWVMIIRDIERIPQQSDVRRLQRLKRLHLYISIHPPFHIVTIKPSTHRRQITTPQAQSSRNHLPRLSALHHPPFHVYSDD